MSPYTTGFNNNIIMQHGRAITLETMPLWESTSTRSSIEVVNKQQEHNNAVISKIVAPRN
jgi:hypothetical protein